MAARDGGRLLLWSTGEAERVDVWGGRGGEEAGAVATTVAMGGRCGRAMVVGAEGQCNGEATSSVWLIVKDSVHPTNTV